jgi:hypothetical protein
MGNPQLDSILARKLNTFLPLSPVELRRLAEMQSKPLTVKRDKQLTQEGQTGAQGVYSAGWLGVQLQRLAQRQSSDHLVSDRWRLRGVAQRPTANRGPFVLGFDRRGGQSRGGYALIGVHHRVSASRGGAHVGRLPG